MEITGAEIIVRCLEEEGVKHVFGYPGGAVLYIYDALYATKSVEHILVRHEQAAVHAAEGYARSTGKVGVVLVTINPAYRPFELKYVLRQSDAVALVLIDRFKSSDYFGMLSEVCPELAQAEPGRLQSEDFPKLRWAVSIIWAKASGSKS